ncbi:hypothetical protein ACVILK_005286 [Bradyrhizobium embrapense]
MPPEAIEPISFKEANRYSDLAAIEPDGNCLARTDSLPDKFCRMSRVMPSRSAHS